MGNYYKQKYGFFSYQSINSIIEVVFLHFKREKKKSEKEKTNNIHVVFFSLV
jgi:hypothetical protein